MLCFGLPKDGSPCLVSAMVISYSRYAAAADAAAAAADFNKNFFLRVCNPFPYFGGFRNFPLMF